jgi:hypothetical protein
MPDAIPGLGALQQALLAALDQMGAIITQSLQDNPGTVFLHQSPGQGVDPKAYLNPWTPEGDVYSLMDPTGTVQAPHPAPGTPGTPDPVLAASYLAARNTDRLVNRNLLLGVKFATPGLGSVADAWGIVQQAVSGDPPTPPAADVQAEINKANALLYVNGRVGMKSPGYQAYLAAQKAVDKARQAKNDAFWKAMADPALGQAWAVDSHSFDDDIKSAQTDLAAADHSDPSMAYSEAASFLAAQGTSMVDAAAQAVKDRWQTFGVMGDSVSTFAYTTIDPPSWCDVTDDSFGAMQISVSNQSYQAASQNSQTDFSKSYYDASSSSDTGGVGVIWGPFAAEGSVSVSQQNSDTSFSTAHTTSGSHWDKSSSASINGEYFIADIDRPWLFEEIFRVTSGWYVKDKPKNYLSDGTATQTNNTNWMPSLIVQMLCARNLTITCNDWGDFGSFANQWSAADASHQHSSTTSYGGSAGYFGIGGSYQHNDADSSGNYFANDDGSQAWSFQSDGQGGTLVIHGTQRLGYIVRVVPAGPPEEHSDTPASTTPATSGAAH